MRILHKYLIVYIISTTIFLILHSWYQGWDFSVYVLNAQYWFSNGMYFEIERAPIMSLIIGIISILGWRLAEYFYVIIVSALFAYSCYEFARSFRVDKLSFYLLSLNLFVLIYGLIEGTELLSLFFVQLFLAFLARRKWYAGLFLGLACLTRYTLVIFLPLLLFQKDVRKIIYSGIAFSTPFIPWFIYNKIYYGNIFYSIASSYALNVLYREYLPKVLVYSNFLLAWNILIPFIILGAFYYLFRERFARRKWILATYFLFSLYSLYSLKSNIVRYFIILSPIGAYLATYCLKQWKTIGPKIAIGLFLIGLITTPTVFGNQGFVKVDYNNLIEDLEPLKGCALKSNIWVPLTYEGRVSEPFSNKELIDQNIKEGYYILFRYDSREPVYILNETFMLEFPIVFENEEYILLGTGCLEEEPVTKSYLQRLNIRLDKQYNYTVSEDPCEILMKDLEICYLVNNI
jgi:hypothetical protein